MHNSVSIASFKLLISLQGDLNLGFSSSLFLPVFPFLRVSRHLNPFCLFSACSVESALLKTKILCVLHKRCCVCVCALASEASRGLSGRSSAFHGKYKIRLGEKTVLRGVLNPHRKPPFTVSHNRNGKQTNLGKCMLSRTH